MRNGRLTPKFGGNNPYEKLTIFQLQKRARRGDPGAEYEMQRRLPKPAEKEATSVP